MTRTGRRGQAGFTLHELMIVVGLIGIVVMFVMPKLERWAVVARTRGAANRVASDVAYTRQLASRTGQGARLVVERGGGCPAPSGWTAGHRYRILSGGVDSIKAVRDLRADGAPLCMAANGSGPLTFRSNGVLAGFSNRTIVLRQGIHPADTLTISAVGRVLRRY
jgi:prepilin-type N-terminal cleavage/methylation domain-containing protein